MQDVFQRFIDATVKKLSFDARACGLAVGGSWATNEIDGYSDLDLIVVLDNDGFESFYEERLSFTQSLGECISSFTGEHVGEPRILICLFNDPLIHVDINFVPIKDFGKRVLDPAIAWEKDGTLTKTLHETTVIPLEVDPQWIEDRFWTWVHFGALKIARGELFETLSFLSFLRERVLAPLKKRELGILPFGVRKMEMYDSAFSKKLEETVAAYDAESCRLALSKVIELYRELRSQVTDVEVICRDEAEVAATQYFLKGANRLT